MIESFRHKGLKRFYLQNDARLLPASMAERIRDILTLLDAAVTIDDINRPTLRLHALKGNLKGLWAVTFQANWRIVFRFKDGDAFDVDFLNYH